MHNNQNAFIETEVSPQFLDKNELEYGEIPGFGKNFWKSDIFVAPTAWHKLFHPEGEYATSRAAEAYYNR